VIYGAFIIFFTIINTEKNMIYSK